LTLSHIREKKKKKKKKNKKKHKFKRNKNRDWTFRKLKNEGIIKQNNDNQSNTNHNNAEK